MNDNLKIWGQVKQPPVTALKQIKGGRLSGMTDIKPQWRMEKMTEVFGPCGTGWKYEIKKLWTLPGADNQVFAFADVDMYYKQGDTWSEAIPGHGGSMLIAKEKAGLHSSDEAFKMAITDALSTAMKAIGVASDIYMGNWDGSKYINTAVQRINDKQVATIIDMINSTDSDENAFLAWIAKAAGHSVESIESIPENLYGKALSALKAKVK